MNPLNFLVRLELPHDVAVVRDVHTRAFGRPDEANLVDALRHQARPFIALVALNGSSPVGHVCFSPVTIEPDGNPSNPLDPLISWLGLGPLAVAPEWQRNGVGSLLVRAGLEECGRQGCKAVVLVGHPEYYPRFGFVPASSKGLRCEFPVPDDVFMVKELEAGCLDDRSGLVRYHPLFSAM